MGQNHPVLDSVSADSSHYILWGHLESQPNESYMLEFYLNQNPDPSGNGEGEEILGSMHVTTDSNGMISFTFEGQDSIATGSFLSCLATDSEGNSSEFSRNIVIGINATVTNTNDHGAGSLRQAILAVNASDLISEITFDIPGIGPHEISLQDQLPALLSPVIIDGYSQNGSEWASESQTALLQIILDGSSLVPGTNGIQITSDSCKIRGLHITGFPGNAILIDHTNESKIEGNWIGAITSNSSYQGNQCGITISNGQYNTIGGSISEARNVIAGNEEEGIRIEGENTVDNLIIGNYIGVSATGSQSIGNGTHGISMNSPNNIVGGIETGMRNIISGNCEHGISIDQSTAIGNSILGNFLGTDVQGLTALANGDCGIWIKGAHNTIGGSKEAANVISGNTSAGICLVFASAHDNCIKNNYIGSDFSGSVPIGNLGPGVWIRSASYNTIGGQETGNYIAFNAAPGIAVQSGVQNLISENRIYSNGGLGIDLSPEGVTPNDDGDVDGGANNRQNYPDLILAEFDSISILTVSGELHSSPQISFVLQFFLSQTTDESGYGEGEIFAGETTVLSDTNGYASFLDEFDVGSLSGLYFLSATATDNESNTSEFGLSIPVHGTKVEILTPVPEMPELIWMPNPMITKTEFGLRIANQTHATVCIYNLSGERIRTLISNVLIPGYHAIIWDTKDDTGKDVAAGAYLYHLSTDDIRQTGRLVVIR